MFAITASIDYALYFISIVIITFWHIIWVMHLCAHANAKLKLKARHCTDGLAKQWPCLAASNCTCFWHHRDKIEPDCDRCHPDNNNNATYNTTTTSHQQPQEHLIGDTNRHYRSQQQQQQQLASTCPAATKTNTPTNFDLPGVSILKPIVGVDANLEANLITFFHMKYPVYELLFCIQDPHDEAVDLVRSLIKRYPYVDSNLFLGGQQVGVNPKINNMQPAYEAAKYELLLISDSGISMKQDTLLDMVLHLGPQVALVHQMPFICDSQTNSFQSILEKVYFGTAHARAYLTADLLQINCPSGMSALMRRQLLDQVGGLAAFGQYLAEDYFMAKSFTDRGWRLTISSQPAWQNSATSSSSDTPSTLNNRIQRWVKLRFAMVTHWTLLEPFSECFLLGLLSSLSIFYLFSNPAPPTAPIAGVASTYQFVASNVVISSAAAATATGTATATAADQNNDNLEISTQLIQPAAQAAASAASSLFQPVAFFLVHSLLWFTSDYNLLQTIQPGSLNFSMLDFTKAWLFRESTALFIFLKALFQPTVTWRSHTYRLKWGGLAEELHDYRHGKLHSSHCGNLDSPCQYVASADCTRQQQQLAISSSLGASVAAVTEPLNPPQPPLQLLPPPPQPPPPPSSSIRQAHNPPARAISSHLLEDQLLGLYSKNI